MPALPDADEETWAARTCKRTKTLHAFESTDEFKKYCALIAPESRCCAPDPAERLPKRTWDYRFRRYRYQIRELQG